MIQLTHIKRPGSLLSNTRLGNVDREFRGCALPNRVREQGCAKLGLLALIAWLALLPPSVLAGQASEVDARKALRSMPGNSWYDNKTDNYATPSVPLERDNPIRAHGWLAKEKPARANNPTRNWWNWNLFSGIAQWYPTFVFSLLGIVLAVAIAILTYYSLRNYLPGRFQRAKSPQAVSIDPARISELPFEVQATHNNPLVEAERLMQSGQFNAAIIYLYGYLLLALDQARRIHLQKGRTNRMYLRDLQSQVRLREIVEQAMLSFEEVFFGKHDISGEQCMLIWSQLDEFHRQLVEPEVPAGVPSQARPATV